MFLRLLVTRIEKQVPFHEFPEQKDPVTSLQKGVQWTHTVFFYLAAPLNFL